MPSRYTENTLCPKCGAKCRIVVTNGIWPMRSQETGICPNCGTEIIRKNITGEIEMELLNEES